MRQSANRTYNGTASALVTAGRHHDAGGMESMIARQMNADGASARPQMIVCAHTMERDVAATRNTFIGSHHEQR
jgi:hypothetical protein